MVVPKVLCCERFLIQEKRNDLAQREPELAQLWSHAVLARALARPPYRTWLLANAVVKAQGLYG